jgi:type III restriction enzyme
VTPITRKLLQHWADPNRENRVIFAQREAAETAIFLTEVAGRIHGYADWRTRLEPENEAHNAGPPRVALKIATGSGKTVVMAMLIAWQTLNKMQSPRDVRFTNRFLVVVPGITIRDRLRVLPTRLHTARQPRRHRDRNQFRRGRPSCREPLTSGRSSARTLVSSGVLRCS